MFSKSKTKRFQDPVSCAPPPGSYNIPDIKKVNLVSFDKSKRFYDPKESASVNVSESSLISDFSSMTFPNQSSCKKTSKKFSSNEKSLSVKHIELDNDMCRKSLEADMEFQESKVKSLRAKNTTLEKQMENLKAFSSELEESNSKLHEVIESLRHEKITIQNEMKALCEKLNKKSEKYHKEKKQAIEEMKLLHMRDLEVLNQEHLRENEILKQKLELSQKLNCDFRKQFESIELTMSENLYGIIAKYEALENSLSCIQKDYNKRLKNSNSLLDRAKEEHNRCEKELESMSQISNSLKQELQELADQNSSYIQALAEKDILLSKFKEREGVSSANFKILEDSKNIMCTELEKLALELQRAQEHSAAEKEKLNIEITYSQSSLTKSKEEIKRLEEENHALKKSLNENTAVVAELSLKIKTAKAEQQTTTEVFLRDTEKFKEEIKVLYARLQSVKEDFQEKLREKDEVIKESKIMHEEVVRRLMETQIKLTKAEESRENAGCESQQLQQEIKLWKEKFEILKEKTGPFMDQLDKFQAEKESLIYENAASQVELGKLSEKYATLLGHQNNKQKIHHVRKLKEENCSLKMEVSKLKSVITKFKKENINNTQPKRFNDDLNTNDGLRLPLKQVNS